MKILYGTTRIVVLFRAHAFKFPRFTAWRLFLHGLLANMQEARFSRAGYPELCPVSWSIWGGFLVVMRRAQPLTRSEFDSLDLEKWVDRGDYIIPAEPKMDSFGYLEGKLVAVDYGS
jgi:hypothetical protein